MTYKGRIYSLREHIDKSVSVAHYYVMTERKTEQSINICRWWCLRNTSHQHDSLGLGSSTVKQSLNADLGFKRFAREIKLLLWKIQPGGGRQEIIHLHNTALKNQWDAFCQGWVTGPRKMSYSGLTTCQQSFTQVGLLDIISVFEAMKKASSTWDRSHSQTAAAIATRATTPEDTRLFTPPPRPQSWWKGSSQMGMFWEPPGYK